MIYLDKYLNKLNYSRQTLISLGGNHKDVYLDENGVESEEVKVLADAYEPLIDAKSEKKAELVKDSEDLLNTAILNKYPRFEIDTWQNQKADSEAYLAGSTSVTITLDALASQRGLSKLAIATKILEKATQFAVLAAKYAGERQRLEDIVDNALTVKEVEAVIFKEV